MKDLLDIIKEELKGVHIEDGTNEAFNSVCEQLSDRLTNHKMYSMGSMQGKESLRDSLKDLLGIQPCNCV